MFWYWLVFYGFCGCLLYMWNKFEARSRHFLSADIMRCASDSFVFTTTWSIDVINRAGWPFAIKTIVEVGNFTRCQIARLYYGNARRFLQQKHKINCSFSIKSHTSVTIKRTFFQQITFLNAIFFRLSFARACIGKTLETSEMNTGRCLFCGFGRYSPFARTRENRSRRIIYCQMICY